MSIGRRILRAIRGRPKRFKRYVEECWFDLRNGVNTRGLVRDVGDEHSRQYQAMPNPKALLKLLEKTGPHDGATFVDLGAGKGKALLLARGFGFARIVGVDIDAGLCEIAKRNMPDAEIVCGDASKYEFDGPAVVFMCNPFDGEIMERVAERIPPGSTVLYYARRHVEPLAARMRLVEDHPNWVILKS